MFASTLLIALVASAVQASPAAKRQAGVSCEQVPLPVDFSLQLRMFNYPLNPPSGGADQPTLPEDGVVLDVTGFAAGNGEQLIENQSTDGSFLDFGFDSCNSTFMGWTTGHSQTGAVVVYYGHFGPADNEGEGIGSCLTIKTSESGEQVITNQKCSTTDDKSQLDQWWKIIVNKDRTQPSIVSFVGQQKSNFDNTKAWDIHPLQKAGNDTVFIASTLRTSGNIESNYYLKFKDPEP